MGGCHVHLAGGFWARAAVPVARCFGARCFGGLVVALMLAPQLRSESVIVEVSWDRWMYPFNATPGTRATGSLFGSVGEAGFDDRDAQVILGFDVSDMDVVLRSKQLQAANLRVTTAGDGFVLDTTWDAPQTYLPPEKSDYVADFDDGRPIELFGVGFRNGFTGFAFEGGTAELFGETSSFSVSPGVFQASRSVFAADHRSDTVVDVSNNVRLLESVFPWAIAVSDTIESGGVVPRDSELEFEIDLADAAISQYLHDGLDHGGIFLALSSLAPASQSGPVTYPVIYLQAGNVALGPTAVLELTFADDVLGDYNGNGTVDAADYTIWKDTFGTTADLSADGNANGVVDAADYTVWKDRFGASANSATTSPSATTVPEPVGSSTILIGLIVVMLTKRHGRGGHRE
ncbi:MAG: hypothetical protein R3E01_04335 [Pirellulaceae bacterium]|nr:hypothetical protein [Planctomycetales bacterium]